MEIKAPQTSRAAVVPAALAERQVVPPSVKRRLKANPFLAPALKPTPPPLSGRLSGWDLMEPLYRSFEQGAGGGAACMELPPVPRYEHFSPQGQELMPHQVEFLESVRRGHRTFLLADEPGLGKTAQSVLAASVAGAFPMLAVVPNVVKINWAREVERWTPGRKVTVIHGDGADMDAFADVFVVNYEILDRHLSWLMRFGFASMVVDEAHFIKNLTSQRSQHVLALAEQVRATAPGGDPLLLALTGTPLINDVEDFHAIWRYLGWVDENQPAPPLMRKLEAIGLTPADRGFYPEARAAVIDMGIVRRQKAEVAQDLPARRIADLPVELDDDLGRSIRQAERELGARLAQRYERLWESRHPGEAPPFEPDLDVMRSVAAAELESSRNAGGGGENVFTMVRRIGQAKATLATDYTAQLARSVGKVVFFAKHIDVMDTAERNLAEAGLKTVSIRGEQTSTTRQTRHRRLRQRPRGRRRGVLAHRGRCRAQPARCLERRPRRALLDGGRAGTGDRPRAPHRSGAARHRVADPRSAHDRHQDRGADRRQARARGPRARRLRRRDRLDDVGAARRPGPPHP